MLGIGAMDVTETRWWFQSVRLEGYDRPPILRGEAFAREQRMHWVTGKPKHSVMWNGKLMRVTRVLYEVMRMDGDELEHSEIVVVDDDCPRECVNPWHCFVTDRQSYSRKVNEGNMSDATRKMYKAMKIVEAEEQAAKVINEDTIGVRKGNIVTTKFRFGDHERELAEMLLENGVDRIPVWHDFWDKRMKGVNPLIAGRFYGTPEFRGWVESRWVDGVVPKVDSLA